MSLPAAFQDSLDLESTVGSRTPNSSRSAARDWSPTIIPSIASSPPPDIREQGEVKTAEEIKATKIHPKIKEEPVTPVRLPRSSLANDEVTKNDSPSLKQEPKIKGEEFSHTQLHLSFNNSRKRQRSDSDSLFVPARSAEAIDLSGDDDSGYGSPGFVEGGDKSKLLENASTSRVRHRVVTNISKKELTIELDDGDSANESKYLANDSDDGDFPEVSQIPMALVRRKPAKTAKEAFMRRFEDLKKAKASGRQMLGSIKKSRRSKRSKHAVLGAVGGGNLSILNQIVNHDPIAAHTGGSEETVATVIDAKTKKGTIEQLLATLPPGANLQKCRSELNALKKATESFGEGNLQPDMGKWLLKGMDTGQFSPKMTSLRICFYGD